MPRTFKGDIHTLEREKNRGKRIYSIKGFHPSRGWPEIQNFISTRIGITGVELVMEDRGEFVVRVEKKDLQNFAKLHDIRVDTEHVMVCDRQWQMPCEQIIEIVADKIFAGEQAFVEDNEQRQKKNLERAENRRAKNRSREEQYVRMIAGQLYPMENSDSEEQVCVTSANVNESPRNNKKPDRDLGKNSNEGKGSDRNSSSNTDRDNQPRGDSSSRKRFLTRGVLNA